MIEDQKKAEETKRLQRESLMKSRVFRLFLIELMEKSRFGRSQGNLDKYSRGRRDAYLNIVQEFVFGTDGGTALFGEFLESQKNKGDQQ